MWSISIKESLMYLRLRDFWEGKGSAFDTSEVFNENLYMVNEVSNVQNYDPIIALVIPKCYLEEWWGPPKAEIDKMSSFFAHLANWEPEVWRLEPWLP